MVSSPQRPIQAPPRVPIRRSVRFTPETTFLVISLVFGTLFASLTPPFQVADESRHFARAYHLSERFLHDGGLITRSEGVPASLVQATRQTEHLLDNGSPRFTTGQLWPLLRIPLHPHRRATFQGMASYSFVSYLPQILTILPLRLAHVNPVLTLYLARFAALLFWAFMTYYALRLLPVARPLLLFVALLPMTLFQAASLSVDSVTFALSFLLIAYYLRLAYRPTPVTSGHLAVVTGLGAALTAAKFVYAPLIGLHFLISPYKFRSHGAYIGSFLLTVGVCLLALTAPFNSLFTLVGRPVSESMSDGITPYPQVNFLLADAQHIGQTAVATLRRFGRSYLDGFVGILGWSGASLPSYLYVSTAVMLWLTALTMGDRFRLTLVQRLYLLAIVGLITLVICFGIATDTRENPLPTVQMRGIQGRYFTPISLLIGLLVVNRQPFWQRQQRWVRALLTPFIVFLLVNAVYCLLAHYYG